MSTVPGGGKEGTHVLGIAGEPRGCSCPFPSPPTTPRFTLKPSRVPAGGCARCALCCATDVLGVCTVNNCVFPWTCNVSAFSATNVNNSCCINAFCVRGTMLPVARSGFAANIASRSLLPACEEPAILPPALLPRLDMAFVSSTNALACSSSARRASSSSSAARCCWSRSCCCRSMASRCCSACCLLRRASSCAAW